MAKCRALVAGVSKRPMQRRSGSTPWPRDFARLIAGAFMGAVACSTASGGRPPPNAAELSARADLEETTASSASPDEAGALREAAAEHRNAARSLIARAESACAGLNEDERAHPPFMSSLAADDVRPATGEKRLLKSYVQELRGAELIVRATPGMTKQWLARQVRCHLAWYDVVGPWGHETFDDPFLVGSPEITFDELETGFVIRIRGRDKAEGEDILRRAMRAAVPSGLPPPLR